jgi:hypothetical protein
MKTLIRATSKARRSFVPIAPFEVENFEVRVRRVTHPRRVPIRVASRRVNLHLPSRQFKTILTPSDAISRAKIFLPSPSLQGHGLMRLHLGARPVDHPAALSSRQLHASVSYPIPKAAREPERPSSQSRNGNELIEENPCSSCLLKRQNKTINITSRGGPKGLIARRSSYD